MEAFTLPLSSTRQITGHISLPSSATHLLPPTPSPKPTPTPLVIALHGGTYDSSYFASLAPTTNALHIPLIALDRPSYGDSSPLPPLANIGVDTSNQVTARLLHETVLPALWREYGERCGAVAVVLHTHSIGSMVGVMVAALHAREASSLGRMAYPLAGLTVCAIGARFRVPGDEMAAIQKGSVRVERCASLWPGELKAEMMLRPSMGLSTAASAQGIEKLNCPFPDAEALDTVQLWPDYWKGYARDVKVPVLYGLPEFDCLWETGEGAVKEFLREFAVSRAVRGGVVRRAPHCVEASRVGRAWGVRSCGFAVECAVLWGMGA